MLMSRGELIIIGVLALLALWLAFWFPGKTFEVRSVDAMAWTQDRVMPEVQPSDQFIEEFVDLAHGLSVTHIALSVPYDDPPGTQEGTSLSFLQRWILAIRNRDLKVWFRMSPVAYKNFYDAGYDFRPEAHQETIVRFIQDNPDLFREGDIFTPIPEPQAGHVWGVNCDGDCMFQGVNELAQWMNDTKAATEQAFAGIGLEGRVDVGKWGLDGFILWGDRNEAWQSREDLVPLRSLLLEADEGYLCPDHYFPGSVKPSNEFGTIRSLFPKAKLWICEWGATAGQSPDYVRQIMEAALQSGVSGFNYWQAGPAGPESLFRFNQEGSLEPTELYPVVQKYFDQGKPGAI
jgi:hypothetical protein